MKKIQRLLRCEFKLLIIQLKFIVILVLENKELVILRDHI